MWNCAVSPGAAVIGCYAKKNLDFCWVFGWWNSAQHYKKKAPQRKGEKTKHGGKDQKSRQKILADCLLAHNDAFLACSTHSEKIFLMYLEGTIYYYVC